jgi:carbamoylphosphate synthase large subunit
MGGQTALNYALDLVREGVLEKFGVEMIAASREAIDMAEDRELFRNAMREIGLECRSLASRTTIARLPPPRSGRVRLPYGHPPPSSRMEAPAAVSP